MAATDSFNTPTKNCENLQAGFAALQQKAFAQASYKSCSLLVYIAAELLALLEHFLTEAQNLHRNQVWGLRLRALELGAVQQPRATLVPLLQLSIQCETECSFIIEAFFMKRMILY